MSNIIKALEQEQMKQDLPQFNRLLMTSLFNVLGQ